MKWRWILATVVAWPLLHLSIFLFRFRSLPPLLELFLFVPTGIIGAWAVHVLVGRSESPLQTLFTVCGALALAPIALIGNLLGGLMGMIGVTVYGAAPLTAGAALGWWFGKRFNGNAPV